MRNSDRWITPAVVVVGLLVVGVCVLATVAGVVYLTARHVDPDPMLKLVASAVSALAGLSSLVLQLAQRRTVAKTEANTGLLAAHTRDLTGVVYDVADAMPRPAAPPRHAYPETEFMPPVHGAAPAARE